MEDPNLNISKSKRSKNPTFSSKKSSPEPGILSESVQPEKSKFSNQDDQCIWHHKQLTLYCETREEPLCEECLSSQYKNLSSKIIPIDEAYRYRISSIYNTLSTHLFGRKEQLEAQSRRIEFRLDELKRYKNKIERDMQTEFGGMIERLGSAFNTHGGLIQSDKQSLVSDLENINDIISELASADRDLVKFLMNYRKIKYSLETAISKPFRSDIKTKPTDLPRELEDIRGLSAKCINLQALVEFKNDMIWNFLHDRVPTCKVTKEIEKELKD